MITACWLFQQVTPLDILKESMEQFPAMIVVKNNNKKKPLQFITWTVANITV